MFTLVALVLFIPSQIFWLLQLRSLGRKLIRDESVRRWVGRLLLALYILLVLYDMVWPKNGHSEPGYLTLKAALVQAPFRWWMLSSLLGFAIMAVFYVCDLVVRTIYDLYRKMRPAAGARSEPMLSPARRNFLVKAAVAVSATPFAACAYGLVYERVEIETTQQRIYLRQLPKAFDGFRIAQISDIHIGPFMPVEEIRRCVDMVNQLKPDLIALTGDFVTWKGSPELDVVEALSGLRAPFGVFGCLGNHEIYADAQDSITRLFAQQGTRILRYQNAAIETGGDRINLIGVDYESQMHVAFQPPAREGFVKQYLPGVDKLMLPGAANILMSHNPNTFDRAAELGIDLSLAGHTHGGQVSLEYISPKLCPAALITRYVRGWYQQGESQIYVNRGIGTIFSPVRVGCPPEITLYELKRA